MLALLQRVKDASVTIDEKIVAQIGQGLLVLIAVVPNDNASHAERIVDRILGYRVFSDAKHRMNCSVQDIEGQVLFVPQFTLAADTKNGMRPSFTTAAEPGKAKLLYDTMLTYAHQRYSKISTGVFGADMQVRLCNDGPVTFLLDVS